MTSLDDNDLGDIQSETQSKNSQLFQTPMPTQDSDKAVLFDLFRVIKNIRVSGIFTGTQTQQNTFINAIETICSGEQEGATIIVSSFSELSDQLNYELLTRLPAGINRRLTT